MLTFVDMIPEFGRAPGENAGRGSSNLMQENQACTSEWQ
jgi:hypothetical protein